MLGWVPFTYIKIPPEDVINPRPIYIQMIKEGQDGVIHWIDDYQTGACKKAFALTSVMDFERNKIAIDDIDNIPDIEKKWAEQFIPCPECYEVWKVRPKTKFVE